MFNSTAMEFDLELFESGSGSYNAFEGDHADNANNVCMQEKGNEEKTSTNTSLVKRNIMGEAFAEAVGGDMNTWLESTSDYQSFVDLTANLSEVKTQSTEEEDEVIDTDALINNVEDFLKAYEAGGDGNEAILPTTDNDHLVDGSMEFPLANSTFTEEDTKAAEDLLDSLLQGELEVDPDFLNSIVKEADVSMETQENTEFAVAPVIEKKTMEDANQESLEKQILGDSGFLDLSNVSQIITEDGRNIIIMVAPSSPVAGGGSGVTSADVIPALLEDKSFMNESVASPAASTVSEAVSDAASSIAEVSTKTVSKGRPVVKRSLVSKTRKAPYSIKDKKERKKLQNVEAARRYRDKKKAEQCDVETEEAGLAEKNKTLKSEVNELESEIRTMRKLMVELGILKK